MASWQPPIPAGALWCKPMRELGPAKAIIEYCYDIVGRDGWCKFKLVEIADVMEEPYINLKRWWSVLQKANEQHHFFAEIRSRGVRGFEVRFSDNWIDWRILNNRTESTPPRSTEEVSTVIPIEAEDQANSIARGTKEVSEEVSTVIPQNNVYGTHNTDQAIIDLGALNAPRKEPEKKRNRDPNQQHPGCLKFFEKTGYRPNRQQAADIATTVTDPDLWDRAMSAWLGKGNRLTDANGMLDWYKHPERFAPKDYSNGSESPQAQNGRMVQRAAHRPANADLPNRPASSGQAEFERQYREWLNSDDESEFTYRAPSV